MITRSFFYPPPNVKVKPLSGVFTTPWTLTSTRVPHPWDCPGKSTGVGCHFLLQGIFPTHGSNPGLLPCRQTLYPLSRQGSLPPRVMDIKTEINKLKLITLKSFCTAKETIKKIKRQLSEFEKMIANEETYKGLISKM